MKEKLLGVVKAALIALIILSGAIAVPVLFRPFYWWHIQPLDIAEEMGMSVLQIKNAYGEMLDYCIGISDTFSVGVLPFSESGAAHFADVRKLFLLDLWVLGIAGVLLAVVCLWNRKKIRLGNHTPGFWSAVGVGVSFLIVGGLAALDFDRAFVVFHKLFFPGKDNWLFNGRTDPVIYMLPEEFFRNCAIFILTLILLSCIYLLFYDRKRKK